MIKWTPRLEVGIDLIDTQHRQLIDYLNRLHAAMMSSQSRAEVPKLLAFLSEYIVSHFRAEERLMRLHGYEHLAEHEAAHESFMREFELAAAVSEQVRFSPVSTIKLNTLLCDWLVEHIGRNDRRLGAFLQRKGLTVGASS